MYIINGQLKVLPILVDFSKNRIYHFSFVFIQKIKTLWNNAKLTIPDIFTEKFEEIIPIDARTYQEVQGYNTF